jgi:hypothetical protein
LHVRFSGLIIGKPTPARVNIVQAWDDYFGEGTLHDWARLCRDLGLEGDFSSKTKCKKVRKKQHFPTSPQPLSGWLGRRDSLCFTHDEEYSDMCSWNYRP